MTPSLRPARCAAHLRFASSPLLPNIFLNEAIDKWFTRWRKAKARSDTISVRYADDSVFGFQYKADAEKFMEALRERFGICS